MKNSLSLNGEWQLAGFEEGQGNWSLPDALAPQGAILAPALVPGEVHVDLHRANLIPDPYYGVNALDVQWVEQKEWWYKRTFDVEEDFLKQRTFLEFDGLDTYATIYLNGIEIGSAENMFVPHGFDVTEVVHEGRNTIAIRFAPTAKVLERMDQSGLGGCFDTPRLNARKMQCAFGWDWTHRFVGAGIWREARLVSRDIAAITDVHIEPELAGGYADAWISVEIANYAKRDIRVQASVVVSRGDAREKIEVVDEISAFGGEMEAVVRIEEPDLWWPNGSGEPALYTCMVGLEFEGEVMDVVETKFGVRTVGIVERNERGRNAFTILINGEEVFCKGGNWVPADHFVSSATPERYRELISLARDANLNMLRVWGGGIYESPAFYEACDEMGIMLWHDFMFSCGVYPDNEQFRREVAVETEAAVKQLRNHPSIVLWCGNNECDMNLPPDADFRGKALFSRVIPRVLRRLDHTRPYRPSSPYGGPVNNDPSEGDWHGGSWFSVYQGDHHDWRKIIERESGLFMSEFPTQGPPQVESLREFIPSDQLFPPDSFVWEFHNKDNPHSGRTDGLSHQQILLDLTRRMMGDFKNVEQFAAYAGILQGEFIKAEFEHYRREKWAISGGMFWMYNDCWPAVSWSVVDYYLRPKIAYYYVRRACEPLLVSFKELEDRVQVYVTSDDRLRGLDATLQVGVLTFGHPELPTQPVPVRLEANSSRAVWESGPLSSLLTHPTRQCLVALLSSRGELLARSVYFALPFADMDFPLPKLLVERQQVEETRHVMSVSANAYARNVAIQNLPALARPSDNFFDLLPGENREITIENLTTEQANDLKINVWRK